MNLNARIPGQTDSPQLKIWVWVYVLLLIFEGALRKWAAPSLSDALIVVRDPIAIYIVLAAWYRRVFFPGGFVMASVAIGLVSFIAALLAGHGNAVVALFGARIPLVHVPLMFALGSILSREDVVRIGRMLLWISIPMTVLIALQFYSPQEAWVNRGVGGDLDGAGFGGAMGYFRPPGTFSFTNGLVAFYSLTAGYIAYFWFNRRLVNRWLLRIATLCLLCTIPLSISRTLVIQVAILMLFALVYAARYPRLLLRLCVAGAVCAGLLVILRDVPPFSTPIEVLTERFDNASQTEGRILGGSIGERYLGSLARGVDAASQTPFWGVGIGMGTNVGSVLLSGDRGFLVAEEEWSRIVGEQGALMGFAFILLRVLIALKMLAMGLRSMRRGDPLAWMLLPFAAVMLFVGQWSQSTMLGFTVVGAGLVLAALQHNEKGYGTK